jgi:hypothetical protein
MLINAAKDFQDQISTLQARITELEAERDALLATQANEHVGKRRRERAAR